MAPIDIVVLAVIGVAFVAVCVRVYRKGTCADCAQGGVCTGHCSNKKTCAALKGVDKIAWAAVFISRPAFGYVWPRIRRLLIR